MKYMHYMLSIDGFWSSKTAWVIGYAMWIPALAGVVVLVDSVRLLLGG